MLLLQHRGFVLRDFAEADRPSFIAYQTDPRYRRLYDLGEDDQCAHRLFDLFLTWQSTIPRRNYQVGIFLRDRDRLCGCAGLRASESAPHSAAFGIEFAPDDWGRYRLALDASATLLDYAFDQLHLDTVTGSTASGNKRVEKLARWFGAQIKEQRVGPAWMTARGWKEVDWTLTREDWRRHS